MFKKSLFYDMIKIFNSGETKRTDYFPHHCNTLKQHWLYGYDIMKQRKIHLIGLMNYPLLCVSVITNIGLYHRRMTIIGNNEY